LNLGLAWIPAAKAIGVQRLSSIKLLGMDFQTVMASHEHLNILLQGVDTWNRWRQTSPNVKPDLRQVNLANAKLLGSDIHPQLSHVNFNGAILFESDLSNADLRRANLREADLHGANLSEANLHEAILNGALLMNADLREANLTNAMLMEANLRGANLSAADLREADLSGATLGKAVLDDANLNRATLRRTFLRGASLIRANLSMAFLSDSDLGEVNLTKANLNDAHLRGAFLTQADLTGADLSGANLTYSRFVEVNLQGASIANCSIYGISAWNINLNETNQFNLIITRPDEPTITVDNIEVAQFIYMLLNNEKIRDVINSVSSKAVLILGRFTAERKAVLDALKEGLRSRDYLPILFDFDKPSSRNLTETVSTLAHIARFVIADITDAKSIPQELRHIVPNLPSLPVQPILLSSEFEYGMFKDLEDYPWVLKLFRYDTVENLLDSIEEKIITPVAAKAKEIEERRRLIEDQLRSY
jgi:uncharacterized protein YjbI with pentapeptide repeats